MRRLRLTRLPLVHEPELLAIVQKSLQPGGSILYIGCFHELTTNFFIGSGYAVHDCQPFEGEHPIHDLKYIIDWASDYEHTFIPFWLICLFIVLGVMQKGITVETVLN